MSSSIQIRPGTRDDLHALYALDLLCFPEPFRFDLELMLRLVGDPAGVVLVAVAEERLAGFVIANLGRRRAGVWAYVTTLDVHPSLRRSGLGGRLMAEMERACFALEAAHISLHVWTENEGALGFYEAIGFVRWKRIAGYYGSAGDAWVYRKSLVGRPKG